LESEDSVLSHLRTAPTKEIKEVKDDIRKHHCTKKIREIKLTVLRAALLEEGADGAEGQTSLRTLVFIFFFLLFLEIGIVSYFGIIKKYIIATVKKRKYWKSRIRP
jgi:hypothetical protein